MLVIELLFLFSNLRTLILVLKTDKFQAFEIFMMKGSRNQNEMIINENVAMASDIFRRRNSKRPYRCHSFFILAPFTPITLDISYYFVRCFIMLVLMICFIQGLCVCSTMILVTSTQGIFVWDLDYWLLGWVLFQYDPSVA